MANPEHLSLLERSVEQWNEWRRSEESQIDLSGANLSGAVLIGADLSGANLSETILNNVTLMYANLSRADLSGADLSGAVLIGADLSNTFLRGCQLLRSNLSYATLTGACIQDWNINKETNLDSVKCEYFYQKDELTAKGFSPGDRRPSDPDSIFAPGEFTKLFQKALETVDLIFVDGIDWKAFFQSFQELRSRYDDETLSIQAIEKKSGGAFIIRLEVPPEADKAAIERRAKELYERDRQLLEAQYRGELHAKERDIEGYKRENSNLTEIVRLLANKPINIEAKAVAESQSKNVEVEMNFQKEVYGAAGKVETMHVHPSPEKQSLAEAAAEIQKLLKQLEETNPTATEAEKQAFVSIAIPPTLRERAVSALQSGGKATIEEFLDNPYVNVAIAIIEGWRSAESET